MDQLEFESNPYHDPFTGKKLKIPNPVNKKKYDKYEWDEYFNCLENDKPI